MPSATDADLIIVGKVIGIIDSKPEARLRKGLQGHWVDVERTLAGSDEIGFRLKIRANGIPWEDGERYILFLKRKLGFVYENLPQSLIPATSANVEGVLAEIAKQGRIVSPKRVLWIQYQRAWGGGFIAEFFVTVDKHFRWKKYFDGDSATDKRFTTWAGSLPEHAFINLIKQIEGGDEKPAVWTSDTEELYIRLVDAREKLLVKRYSPPTDPRAAMLLENIESVVDTYGQRLNPIPPPESAKGIE